MCVHFAVCRKGVHSSLVGSCSCQKSSHINALSVALQVVCKRDLFGDSAAQSMVRYLSELAFGRLLQNLLNLWILLRY